MSAPIDTARFRQVLGHMPTGVTVVTAVDDGQPVGMAIGSFTSVSLDPPQVLFCANQTSASWGRIRNAGAFCVNVLAETQEDVCRVMASKADDKFAGVAWRTGGNGAPVLADVVAHIECTVDQIVPAGDHDIVVGAVTELSVDHEVGPLLFFRGGYGRFAV